MLIFCLLSLFPFAYAENVYSNSSGVVKTFVLGKDLWFPEPGDQELRLSGQLIDWPLPSPNDSVSPDLDPVSLLHRFLQFIPNVWTEHRQAFVCYLDHLNTTIGLHRGSWVIVTFKAGCQFSFYRFKPSSLVGGSGFKFQVGKEVTFFKFRTPTSSDQDFAYSSRVKYERPILLGGKPYLRRVTEKEFLWDTGAADCYLDWDDTILDVSNKIIELSVSATKNPYMFLYLDIHQIDNLQLIPPVNVRFGVPLTRIVSQRALGLNLMLQAQTVAFLCGRVVLFWNEPTVLSNKPHITSNAIEIEDPKDFVVSLLVGGRQVEVFVNIGSIFSVRTDLKQTAVRQCLFPSVEETISDGYCYKSEFEILGKRYESENFSNQSYSNYNYVMGWDVSRQVDMYITKNITHAVLHVFPQCSKTVRVGSHLFYVVRRG